MSVTLPNAITEIITGVEDNTAAEQIDRNLRSMQLAMGSIDAVKIVTSQDSALAGDKARAMAFAMFGTGGPAMTGAAMLLLYQVALAMFIGLGPIFIMCLLFEVSKPLFQRWLLYGIGTMFSMAVLAAMVAIATDVVEAVAQAFWVTSALNLLTGGNLQAGMSSMALQQGGLGLLLTVLLISTPPMAASFFQGTLGQFYAFTQFGGGAASSGAAPGYRPGEPGYGSQPYGGSPPSRAPVPDGQNTRGGQGTWTTQQHETLHASPKSTNLGNVETGSGRQGLAQTNTTQTGPQPPK